MTVSNLLNGALSAGGAGHRSHDLALPRQVLADLRTDHAGETGAVCIYLGVLRFSRDTALRAFAQSHLATEKVHLCLIEDWLSMNHRSRLLPVWRLAGFLTGALPALIGPRAVYATIEAVETFVDHHYNEQIRRLETQPSLAALRQTLMTCQLDEIAHRDEAAAAHGPAEPGFILRTWCRLVDVGSRSAVAVCRHI